MNKILINIMISLTILSGVDTFGDQVRIKDIASFQLDSDLQLIGFGLVVGLDGTGDTKSAGFTAQSLSNMMERMGITVPADGLKVKNVASVMVTANLFPAARIGTKIDCVVSSVGDASSLQGGILLATPLSGLDGMVYGTAQGPVSIGGFNIQSSGGDRISENYSLVGRVPGGVIIEKQRISQENAEQLFIRLTNPDFTTCQRLANKINGSIGSGTADAIDDGNVRVNIPASLRNQNGIVGLISRIEILEITPDSPARVVVNEKTGTIVAGENVTVSSVALAHGNLKIEIKATPQVSQPQPFSQGQTVVTRDSEVTAEAEPARIINMKESASIGDLAEALNNIGATPRDIIAIFQALKVAGALRAELIIM